MLGIEKYYSKNSIVNILDRMKGNIENIARSLDRNEKIEENGKLTEEKLEKFLANYRKDTILKKVE